MALDRRSFLGTAAALGAAAALPLSAKAGKAPSLEEATLDELQAGLASGRWTSVALVKAYTARIKALDWAGPKLRSVLELNPDALKLAAELDAERKAGRVRSPLHGIPVLLKDNIDTADRMHTTAGSWALYDAPAPRADAHLAARLREAGALLLGKTNLSEWANFRSTHAISGWSGRGGQTRNPYALDRNPSGSSSGSAAAVAASLCAVAVGSETDGSIVSPSSICGIVGLKPTLGRVSRSGIIPISHSQDTAGPMGRCVKDVAYLLGALAGADPQDPPTAQSRARIDFASTLTPDALKGAKLGVLRSYVGQHPGVERVMQGAFATLQKLGATLVDVELPGGFDAAELDVLLYEFKADLNAYLAGRGGAVKDLEGLIAFDSAHAEQELRLFGQELLLQAQAKGPLTEEAYLKARETCVRLARTEGIEGLLEKQGLDALVAPTGAPAWLTDPVNGDSSGFSCSSPAAVAGCPHLTVPAGFTGGLPVALSFMGKRWSEHELLRFGYAFEQATRARRAPRFAPTVHV